MEKRILHIVPSYIGGVKTVVDEIINNLDYNNVTLVVFEGGNNSIKKNIKFTNLEHSNFFRKILMLYNIIKSNDIIHVHQFPALYYCAILRMLFFRNKKFIFTEHASNNNRRNVKMLKFVEILIYKQYDYVIAVSNSCKKNLLKWLNNSIYVKTINNGININQFTINNTINFKELNIDSRYIITMVSRLNKDKDFKTLLHSMIYLDNNFHLILVGDGVLRKNIEQEIKKYNLSDKITLLGFREDVKDILYSSSISVLSSYAEGMSLAIFESLAVNTPCIGSDVDGICDVLPSKYRFKVGDSKRLAEMIKQTVTDKEYPFEEILNPFSLDKMLNSYNKIYSSDNTQIV
ncbi:glycosyltransferase [Bacteroides caecigallinarum]|nr:glycosyltransferase [Bacteroides caecigallinarum]